MSSINPVFILNGASLNGRRKWRPACMVRSRWAWDNSAPARDWFLSSPARGRKNLCPAKGIDGRHAARAHADAGNLFKLPRRRHQICEHARGRKSGSIQGRPPGRRNLRRRDTVWASAETFLENHNLMDEVFLPPTLIVECSRARKCSQRPGKSRTVDGFPSCPAGGTRTNQPLVNRLVTKAGRLVFNGFPTGVEVTHAMTQAAVSRHFGRALHFRWHPGDRTLLGPRPTRISGCDVAARVAGRQPSRHRTFGGGKICFAESSLKLCPWTSRRFTHRHRKTNNSFGRASLPALFPVARVTREHFEFRPKRRRIKCSVSTEKTF